MNNYLRGLRPLSHFPSETRFPGRKRGRLTTPWAGLGWAGLGTLGVDVGRAAGAEHLGHGLNSAA